MAEEIELNFRLDREGRTALGCETASTNTSTAADDKSKPAPTLKYEPKTVLTELALDKYSHDDADGQPSLMDDLLFDAEIADSGLMPRTFWMSANPQSKPRFTMERYALDVFHHHVPKGCLYDPDKSGAEWWVQIRPSPEKIGRYAMHASGDNDTNKTDGNDAAADKDIAKTGISFHWDKDEDLRLLTGGTLYIHPHLSTVTYLTDLGCPTVAMNCRVNNFTGDWIPPSHAKSCWSWPKRGKHLSFDGRYLHAALPDVMKPKQFEHQCAFVPSVDALHDKKMKRRHRRVTFLVNIWLNYIPYDVKPFPHLMVTKMSGHEQGAAKRLGFVDALNPADDAEIPVHGKPTTVEMPADQSMEADDDTANQTSSRTWPMGDSNSSEFIRMCIPIQTIQGGSGRGADVQVNWQAPTDDTFHLFKQEAGQKRSAAESSEENGDTGTVDTAPPPAGDPIVSTNNATSDSTKGNATQDKDQEASNKKQRQM